jgi:hypothetical protein
VKLGRLLEHDPRSRNFAAARAPELVTVLHKRRHRPFDQGNLGSCTGMAMTGLLDTKPFRHNFLSERTALRFYKWATANDNNPGQYPPDDTGSSGLAVAKAALHYRYIISYAHAFGLQHALEALGICPVITGVNWYSSMDVPDANDGGLVRISPDASIRGGHEFEVLGNDVERQRVRCAQSWGREWGDHGYFELEWATWDRLLSEDGDVTTVQD